MYYPYFRGKQFDLLAIKELVKAGGLSKQIVPIIEPVKQSKTLLQTLELLRETQHPFYLIDNPESGAFLTTEGQAILQELARGHRGHILTEPLTTADQEDRTLWYAKSVTPLKESDPQFLQGRFLVPPEMRILRQLQGASELILLEDVFTRLPRNSYYREFEEELFTNRHHNYATRGFGGFGDFSLDNRIYYEQGYPDRDLCLHLVYPDQNGQLRVHHFTSPPDSDEERLSQKEKFLLLMESVISSLQEGILPPTRGLELLTKAAFAERFPGMGVMRKAVIMHHLEVMGTVL